MKYADFSVECELLLPDVCVFVQGQKFQHCMCCINTLPIIIVISSSPPPSFVTFPNVSVNHRALSQRRSCWPTLHSDGEAVCDEAVDVWSVTLVLPIGILDDAVEAKPAAEVLWHSARFIQTSVFLHPFHLRSWSVCKGRETGRERHRKKRGINTDDRVNVISEFIIREDYNGSNPFITTEKQLSEDKGLLEWKQHAKVPEERYNDLIIRISSKYLCVPC